MLKDILKLLSGGTGKSPATISRSIRQSEDISKLYEIAVGCYTDTVESIGEYAPDSPRGAREELRKKMKGIRASIRLAHDRASFEETHKSVDGELKGFTRLVEQHIASQERDAKEIMALMASMADSVASRDKQHNVRFKGIAKKLRLLTTSQDLAEIRAQLSAEVGQLEIYVDDMSRDTQAALERVKSDLQARERAVLKTPEWTEQPVDPQTQFAGRTEALVLIDGRLRGPNQFCLARFTIQGYPQLAARHSPQTMGELIKEFAARLKKQLPEAALYSRWSESELAAVVECHLPDLAGRAVELERRLSGAFSLPSAAGGSEQIAVSCVSHIVQAVRGESAAQLADRLSGAGQSLIPTR